MRKLAALALAALGVPLGVAAPQRLPCCFAGVDSAMAGELSRTGTPAGAVAIVSGDRVVYAKGFGHMGADGGSPVTAATVFRIASVTKLFTAAALVDLARTREMDLGSPIDARLGLVPDPLRRVTPHQLLSHTAGLQFGPVIPGGPDPSTALALSVSRIPDRVAFTAPGDVFSYSNIGYEMAGRLVEVLAGRPFAAQVKAALLDPLDMRVTGFDPATLEGASVAPPTPDSGATTPVGGAESWPFAGLYSSVGDLSHFAIAFMNGGRYRGRRVMEPASIARIATPAAAFQSGEGDYGYGVRIYRHRGVGVVEHGGNAAGYRALLYMVPDRRVAVIVLANRAGRRPYGVVDAALEALIPDLAPAAAPPGYVPMPPDEMARYAGHYAGGAVVQLSVDDGVLTMHQGTTALPVRKLATGGFTAGDGDARTFLAFVTGADGNVRYLHVNMRAYRRLASEGPGAPPATPPSRP